jgi:MFS family permease
METDSDVKAAEIGLMEGVGRVLSNKYFWPVAIWFFFDCGIFFGFGALWGGPYLMHVYGLSQEETGAILSMIAYGMIVGSPFLGFVSDRVLKSRKKPFMICTGILTCLLLCLYLVPAGLPKGRIVCRLFCSFHLRFFHRGNRVYNHQGIVSGGNRRYFRWHGQSLSFSGRRCLHAFSGMDSGYVPQNSCRRVCPRRIQGVAPGTVDLVGPGAYLHFFYERNLEIGIR